METLNAIVKRKSVRAYKEEQLSSQTLDRILAAGCAAPVGMKKYETLHLTVVQNKEVLGQISNAVCQVMNRDGDPLYGGPTVILFSSQAPMAPGIDYVNAACIAENMLLAATDAGVGSVIVWGSGMAVEATSDLKKILNIPEGFKTLFGVVLGYAATEDPSEKELKISLSINRV